MRLKTKLIIGLGFLFIVILVFGILSIASINRLKNNSDKVLKNNYETLVYNNNMLEALNKLPADASAWKMFEDNLQLQEANVTERGEAPATIELRSSFNTYKLKPGDSLSHNTILKNIQFINQLNQQAILQKNELAKNAADTANTWLTLIFTVLALIAFTLVVNFPSVISGPIQSLSEGISAIAGKNYKKRIHLKQKDEFGDLANAFNTMAEKLDEYEHSNLAKIKFEKSRIETIINKMNDAIIGFDEKRNILFMNAVAESLLNLKEKDVLGKYAADLALKNDLMRRLLQNGDEDELKIYADRKESYFSKEKIIVKNEEQVIGEVIVLQNITPFHELDEAKTNFIATISHELKTPISSILMSAKLLDDERVGTVNQEQKGLVQHIKEDSERLLKITGELLNLTQVEAGKIQLAFQPVMPNEILLYAIGANKTQAEQQKQVIEMRIDPAVKAVNADKEKTSWVLTNLVANAIRYSFEDSKIIVSAERKDNTVVFSVQDFGKGIDSNYKDKIFDRYFRVPGNKEEGTGLGLAICREFIEAQGGKIWVESDYGDGSKFSFWLPLA
jgi:signal transduction histidine kinase